MPALRSSRLHEQLHGLAGCAHDLPRAPLLLRTESELDRWWCLRLQTTPTKQSCQVVRTKACSGATFSTKSGASCMADPLEFDERELWESGHKERELAPSESGGEEELPQGREDSTRKRGASSTSSSDSEYEEQPDHNIKAFRGPGSSKDATPTVPIDFTGSFRRRPRSRRGSLDQREPVKSKLGTSMPINIPMMSSRRAKNVDASELQDRASTFIPPHLLEQADARAGMSISSASVAKREKLLQRNAILRRTGFIETESRQLSEIMDPLNRRKMAPIQESLLEPSALSAALGSPNSKQ